MPHKDRKTPKQLQQELIDHLSRTTNFKDKHIIELLLKKFKEYTGGKKFITREIFKTEMLQEKFQFTDDLIMDRVFRAFDIKNTGKVDEEEFVKGMSIFLRGTPKECTEFVFKVYDFNNDGYLSKDEMLALLKGCLTSSYSSGGDDDIDEGQKELCDIVTKKLDTDSDNKVSIEDFEHAVMNDNLLLEVLGTCLPTRPCVELFMRETLETIY